jgi:hypothetical protein
MIRKMGRILKDVRILKKIQRNPEKYDALGVFATWAQRHGVAITHEDAVEQFATFLRDSLRTSLNSDTMLFGSRTQAMFEAIVANLGAVQLVKTEDTGDIYSAEADVKIPDTRVVLSDGRNLLVEVKNTHVAFGEHFRVRSAYANALARYASLTNAAFRFAIYWSRLATWSLVPVEAFARNGQDLMICFQDSVVPNDMGALGDTLIAYAPLTLRMCVRKGIDRVRSIDPTRTQVFVGNQEVLIEPQKTLAKFLFFWGGGHMSPPRVLSEDAHERLVESRCSFSSDDESDDTQISCFTSSLLSRYWLHLTSNLDGDFATLLPDRNAWTDQLLKVTNEGQALFVIGRCTSSLDAESSNTEPDPLQTHA